MSRAVPPLRGLHIRSDKRVDYLLDPTHPKGEAKAVFLMRFGFSAAEPSSLGEALARHFAEAPDAWCVIDAAGRQRIVCEGPIACPDGREPAIRSVWKIEPDDFARLITIYPRRGRKPRTD